MGSLKNSEYSDLTTLRDSQDKSPHGWATDTCGLATRTVDRLHATGLCELTDDDTLSTLPGPPKWAARLTAEGHDTLIYVPQRRATTRPPHPTTAHPEDAREVTLLPQAMDAVRLCLSLTGGLRRPPPRRAWKRPSVRRGGRRREVPGTCTSRGPRRSPSPTPCGWRPAHTRSGRPTASPVSTTRCTSRPIRRARTVSWRRGRSRRAGGARRARWRCPRPGCAGT